MFYAFLTRKKSDSKRQRGFKDRKRKKEGEKDRTEKEEEIKQRSVGRKNREGEEDEKRKCSWSLFWINQKLRVEKCDQIIANGMWTFV